MVAPRRHHPPARLGRAARPARRFTLLLTAALASGACQPPSGHAPTADQGRPSDPSTVATDSSGADTSPGPSARRHRSVTISGVPHIRQKPDFCGEAAAAMALQAQKRAFDQDDVFGLTGMDPARGMGATTRELKTALERVGYRVGPVWHSVRVATAQRSLEALFADMLDDLHRQVPSIVCMHYDEQPNTTEHFRLVLGYDADSDELLYHEPAEAGGAYRRMKRTRFLELWPLKYQADRWTVIRFELEPAKLLSAPPPRAQHTPADFAQHVRKLRQVVPRGFTIVVQPPFVVIGDEAPAMVQRRADSTVRWAVERLKRAYFSKDPKDILDIWLFKNDRSYRHHARSLFGDDPHTPYGYYSDRNKALVMNIATGGGTLVHEIVHPFMDQNFPACPTWFNEAMGSLYEQSSSRDGQIVGLTNWRLAGLQDAIRAGSVPSFRTLMSTTRHQFYERDPGTNYAQARYLVYHLQERGLLRKYYRQFVANHRSDPTGMQTLKTVLGEQDLAAFQRRWQTYVMKLTFP